MTQSERMKKRWKEDISFRNMMIQQNKERWLDPVFAKRVSCKMSKTAKKRMKDPVLRKQISDKIKEIWKINPEKYANFLKNGHSSETIEKMRKTKTGIKLSKAHRVKIKIGLIIAGKAGRLSRYSKLKLPPNLKIAQSKSPFQKGDKNINWNPNYQDNYGYEFTRKLKKDIHIRDRNNCQKCQSTKKLVIHHIDENKYNNLESNLITLCRSCHMKVHHNSIKLPNTVAVLKPGYMLEQPERRNPQGLALTVNQQATCESRESPETTRQDLNLRYDIVRSL